MFFTTEDFKTCKDEQSFKQKYIKAYRRAYHVFCIETEETVKGFPDVLLVSKETGKASFLEFKFAKKGSTIHFQANQPAFYRLYPDLDIKVICYVRDMMRVHVFRVADLFNKDSAYCLNGKAEVNLSKFRENPALQV